MSTSAEPKPLKPFRDVVDQFVSKHYFGDPKWIREEDREELARLITEEHKKLLESPSEAECEPIELKWPVINADEYRDAIEKLQQAMTQLVPDGNNCVICGDAHQAWECRHNPLVLARSYIRVEENAGELHELLHKMIFRGV